MKIFKHDVEDHDDEIEDIVLHISTVRPLVDVGEITSVTTGSDTGNGRSTYAHADLLSRNTTFPIVGFPCSASLPKNDRTPLNFHLLLATAEGSTRIKCVDDGGPGLSLRTW